MLVVLFLAYFGCHSSFVTVAENEQLKFQYVIGSAANSLACQGLALQYMLEGKQMFCFHNELYKILLLMWS